MSTQPKENRRTNTIAGSPFASCLGREMWLVKMVLDGAEVRDPHLSPAADLVRDFLELCFTQEGGWTALEWRRVGTVEETRPMGTSQAIIYSAVQWYKEGEPPQVSRNTALAALAQAARLALYYKIKIPGLNPPAKPGPVVSEDRVNIFLTPEAPHPKPAPTPTPPAEIAPVSVPEPLKQTYDGRLNPDDETDRKVLELLGVLKTDEALAPDLLEEWGIDTPDDGRPRSKKKAGKNAKRT